MPRRIAGPLAFVLVVVFATAASAAVLQRMAEPGPRPEATASSPTGDARASVSGTPSGQEPAAATVEEAFPLDAEAVAVPTPAGVDMAALREQVEPLVSSFGGDNAVTITDLQTGQALSVNGARTQISASVIKIFILMAVAEDIEAGKYSAGTVRWLVYNMMGPSDNGAAHDLIQFTGDGSVEAGIDRIHRLMLDLGMTDSVMRHPPGYIWESYDLGTGDNVVTTDELNLALGKLYRGEALSPWATAYVFSNMTLATPFLNGSIGGPLPDDTKFYHKTGWVTDTATVWNDTGVVTFERDGNRYAYAISYLYSGGWDYMDGYRHASQVSQLVWEAFDKAYSMAQ